MYVMFLKNFDSAEFDKLTVIRLILASCAESCAGVLAFEKALYSNFLDIMVHEKFSTRRLENFNCHSAHFSLMSPKTLDPNFLVIMYVVMMQNFDLAERNSLTTLSTLQLPEQKST